MSSLAIAERRASRIQPAAGSPSIRWRPRSPSPPRVRRAEHANSPSLLGPSESPVPGDDGEANSDSDNFEECPPITQPAPRVTLPTEFSPSLRAHDGSRQEVVPQPLAAPPPVAPADAWAAAAPPLSAAPANEGKRLVRVKNRVVAFKRAPCKRASRAARPSEPSDQAREVCRDLVHAREGELKGAGRTKLQADDLLRYRAGGASGGKGPAIRAQVEQEQAKMNHVAQLKARNVETYNNEASFLLWGNTAEQCYDKLAESALRANAGNSCVTKRQPTQGAGFQTT